MGADETDLLTIQQTDRSLLNRRSVSLSNDSRALLSARRGDKCKVVTSCTSVSDCNVNGGADICCMLAGQESPNPKGWWCNDCGNGLACTPSDTGNGSWCQCAASKPISCSYCQCGFHCCGGENVPLDPSSTQCDTATGNYLCPDGSQGYCPEYCDGCPTFNPNDDLALPHGTPPNH